MFRSVPLPDSVRGTLFLHSMPGRLEPFDDAKIAIVDAHVKHVVCLTPASEVEERSPDYAQAIASGLPWHHIAHPIPDFGVPHDEAGFARTVDAVVAALRNGENVLVHCAAGIGRTGTFAVAVLVRLGIPLREARRTVRAAGSSAESEEQVRFLERFARAHSLH